MTDTTKSTTKDGSAKKPASPSNSSTSRATTLKSRISAETAGAIVALFNLDKSVKIPASDTPLTLQSVLVSIRDAQARARDEETQLTKATYPPLLKLDAFAKAKQNGELRKLVPSVIGPAQFEFITQLDTQTGYGSYCSLWSQHEPK
jgi:hypothetical protein